MSGFSNSERTSYCAAIVLEAQRQRVLVDHQAVVSRYADVGLGVVNTSAPIQKRIIKENKESPFTLQDGETGWETFDLMRSTKEEFEVHKTKVWLAQFV